jgi:hypothetical protein
VLSQFAGAAAELTGALIVNPHECDATAAALKRALGMPLFERRARHGPMLDRLLVHNIDRWAEDYLAVLAETDASAIEVSGQPFQGTPGTATAVEIKTGMRRIIDYLFSPLVEVSSSALREKQAAKRSSRGAHFR